MTYPVANEEQANDIALRAAAHSRWVELREHRKPRDRSGTTGHVRCSWAKSCVRSTHAWACGHGGGREVRGEASIVLFADFRS
jgi:hypothetical protein